MSEKDYMENKVLTYRDFNEIIEAATKIYNDKRFPIRIEKREILSGLNPQYCVVLATIALLTKKGYLKEIVPDFKD